MMRTARAVRMGGVRGWMQPFGCRIHAARPRRLDVPGWPA